MLSPNSRGQEMAKDKTHTTEIITVTRRLELYRVLYNSGMATAVYLEEWSGRVGGTERGMKIKSVSEETGDANNKAETCYDSRD